MVDVASNTSGLGGGLGRIRIMGRSSNGASVGKSGFPYSKGNLVNCTTHTEGNKSKKMVAYKETIEIT